MLENELNELSGKVELISTKGLTKNLINKDRIFNSAKYVSSCVLPDYLVFISAIKYIELFCDITQMYSWKPKGTSGESIEKITISENTFAPTLVNSYQLSHIKFGRNCFINSNIFVFRKLINLYLS